MLGLPQVYRDAHDRSYSMFYNEGREPAHVHVHHAGRAAKFWLNPFRLCKNYGFNPAELRAVERGVATRLEFLRRQWDDVKARRR